MANIIIKNNEGTQVIAKDVDTIKLPTTNGGTAAFRQWNGISQNVVSVSTKQYKCKTTTINANTGTVSVLAGTIE